MNKETATTENTENIEITKTLLNEPPAMIGEHITKRDVAQLIARGFAPEQVKTWAIFHGAEAGEAEKAITEAQEQVKEDFKRAKEHPERVYRIKKLDLFPGLTKEEAKKRLESLADKDREQAAAVVHLIPAVQEIIKTIATRGEEGKIFLTEAGESFTSLLAPAYMPKWDIDAIRKKINGEQYARFMIAAAISGIKNVSSIISEETAKIDTLSLDDTENPERAKETILSQLQFITGAMFKTFEKMLMTFGERQSRLYAEIKEETQNIETLLNSYYDSAYFQAYTIAKEIPVTSPELINLAMIYFFATSKIAPDETAPESTSIIKEGDAYYLKSIVGKLNRFFSTYAPNITPTESNRFYITFIDFIYNETTNKNPEISGVISAPGHAAIPFNPKYRYMPDLKKKDGYPEGYDQILGERILNTLWPYYEKSTHSGLAENLVSINKAEFIEQIIGKQNNTIITNKPVKEWEAGEKASLWNSQITPTINALGKISAPVSEDTPEEVYGLLAFYGENLNTGNIKFISPWMIERSRAIHKEAKHAKRKNKVTGKTETPEINPFASVIINITKETPYVRELTAAILAGAQYGIRFRNYPFTPARLIREECPRLYKAINEKPTNKEKSLLLKRTFQRFYKIIEMPQKVAIYDYFLPITSITKDKDGKEITSNIKPYFLMMNKKTGKVEHPTEKIHTIKKKNKKTGEETHIQIKEIAPPYPTYKNWDNVIIKFCHGGKNPDYKRPL